MTVDKRINELIGFFRHGLWDIEPSDLRPLRRSGLRLLQFGTVVTREFIADRCLLHASALAFTTILSIVPLLAIMFALLKGFGAEVELEILILNHLALGSEEVIDAIFTYISNSNLGKLGVVGLVSLVLSVLTLLTNIEQSFNHIWGVNETRSLTRRFADYFSITSLGPILILAAISMTTTVESKAFVQHVESFALLGQVLLVLFKILPYLTMWAAFTGLYLFMPNTSVRWQSALLGGAFGGVLWQVVQWGYVNFQFGVSRYNAIYGTMAALPIFMIWIYASWLIVLLGLEVTFALQNFRSIRQELRAGRTSQTTCEDAALALLLTAGRVFTRGETPLGAEDFAARLHLPPRLTRQLLRTLVRLGFLCEVTTHTANGEAYQPARALESMTPHGLFAALRQEGDELTLTHMGLTGTVVAEVRQQLDDCLGQGVAEMTVRDLVVRLEAGKPGSDQRSS